MFHGIVQCGEGIAVFAAHYFTNFLIMFSFIHEKRENKIGEKK
tara:strand:+ start:470 stop:598 length:129 start_codon:yes stop_codon:yes gene_type:complete